MAVRYLAESVLAEEALVDARGSPESWFAVAELPPAAATHQAAAVEFQVWVVVAHPV